MTRNRFLMHSLAGSFLVLIMAFVADRAPAQDEKPPPFPPIDATKARLVQTLAGLDGPGFDIVSSDDFDMIFVACDRGSIQSWNKDVLLNIRTGSGSANRWKGHDGPVRALAWSGGPIFASAGIDQKINFWSVKEGSVIGSANGKGPIRTLAMFPDHATLASAGEDAAIQLWEVATTKPKATLTDHNNWITGLAVSPDGKLLASSDYGGTVLLWSDAGKKLREVTPVPNPKEPPPALPVEALAFSPDNKMLAIGSTVGDIHLVNPGDGKVIRTLKGHTSAVTGLAFHPAGQVLVSASRDRTVKLWNPANGQVVKNLEGHNAWVEGVVFTNRGTQLASVSADRTVKLWALTE